MAGWISCVSMNRTATSQNVCPLRIINARMPTRFLVRGAIFAPMHSPAAPASPEGLAVSSPRCRALLRTESLILNGVPRTLPLRRRRRISRCACMRIIPTSDLTSFSGPYNPAAINSMFRACRDLVTRSLRTSATLTHRLQDRALTPALLAERRHLRPRRQQRPRLRLRLRRQRQQQHLQQQQPRHRDQHPRRD